MKKITINATFEGETKDYVDIETQDLEIIRNIPFFDKEGNTITYDEALELYGEYGLSDGIWDDENYLKYIESWINE